MDGITKYMVFFHFVLCFLSFVTIVSPSVLSWLNITPLYGYCIFNISIHQLMDIWVGFSHQVFMTYLMSFQ